MAKAKAKAKVAKKTTKKKKARRPAAAAGTRRKAGKTTRKKRVAAGGTALQSAVKKKYDWTVMLYLSGDNNLSEEMVRALNDIRFRGVPSSVAFTIQYDPRAPCCDTYRYAIPTPISTQVMPVLPLPIPEHFVESLEDENSADPDTLADFIEWSSKIFDSKRRMLILSGHGSGAMGDFLRDEDADEGQPGSLTVPQLAHAFDLAARRLPRKLLLSGGAPRLLHVLGMDSCLMSMVEVCYEVRRHVDHIVGSEGFVPNAGWPYAHLLDQLRGRNPRDLSPSNMVKWIVEDCVAYFDQYIPAGVSFDMAACQLQALPRLAAALSKLTDQLISHFEKKKPSDTDKDVRDMVVLAHWRAQSYKFEQYTDLWDFANELAEVAGRSGRSQDLKDIVTACRHVKTAVNRVVTDRDHCGAEFQHSHGLSVYFPWSRPPFDGDDDLAVYGEMTFPEASGWHDFLKACLDGTRREELKVSGKTEHLTRFGRQWPAQADSAIRAAEGVNRAAERVNRAAERVNRAAERVNRYNDLIMQLYGGPGRRLPWSMKNPPQGVQWAPKKP